MLSGLILLVSPICIIVSLILLLFRGARSGAMQVLGCAFVLLLSVLIGGFAANGLRDHEFRMLGDRSMPLVNAIAKYERVNGRPPKELADLVPEYIQRIPGTGFGSYPDYEYEVLEVDKPSPWELRVPCGVGMLNWDVFFYWPTKKYPDYIYGGGVERMGDWAYVHE